MPKIESSRKRADCACLRKQLISANIDPQKAEGFAQLAVLNYTATLRFLIDALDESDAKLITETLQNAGYEL